MACKINMLTTKSICEILLQIILITGFISVFFFTYGKQIEKEVVENQTKLLASTFTKDIVVLPRETQEQLKVIAQKLKAPDFSAQDQKAAESNKKLETRTFHVIFLLALTGIILIGLLWGISNKNSGFRETFALRDITRDSFIILTCIAIVEFSIATFVLRNYRAASSNYVMKEVVGKVQTFASTCGD
jgi:hypothetical protein